MTTLDYLFRRVIPAASDLLPEPMRSPQAAAMLLAIALQESKVKHRRQLSRNKGGRPGPARGLWQFESGGGVLGVMTHRSTKGPLRAALVALAYPTTITRAELHAAIEHNDVLACVSARLLLWTLPSALPASDAPEEGWRQYRAAWRPGQPHPQTWGANYSRAWSIVNTALET